VVLSSRLTLVECDRTLLRLVAAGVLAEAERAGLSALLASAASRWRQLAITEPILDRARLPFPGGTLRTLDAVHLASALEARAAMPELAVLSLDDRMRKAARSLGFAVVPA
jgi:hypothetical protein